MRDTEKPVYDSQYLGKAVFQFSLRVEHWQKKNLSLEMLKLLNHKLQ